MKHSIHAWSFILVRKQGKWITHIGKALGFLFYDQQFKKTPQNPNGDPNWSENYGWGFILAIQIGAIIQPIPDFRQIRFHFKKSYVTLWENEWKSGHHWFTLRIPKAVVIAIHLAIMIIAWLFSYHLLWLWLIFPPFFFSLAIKSYGIYYGVKDIQLDNRLYAYPLDKTKKGWLSIEDFTRGGEAVIPTGSWRRTRDV